MSTSHASSASPVLTQFLGPSWFVMTLLAWHLLYSRKCMSLGQDCLLQLEWGRGRLRTGSPGSEHTVGRVAGIFQH